MKGCSTLLRASMLCAIALCAGCAAPLPRQAESGRGAPSPVASRHGADVMPVLVYVDTGELPLGAYELVFRYDPAVVRVVAVSSAREEAGDSAFDATPMSNPSTFTTGSTPIIGFVASGPVRSGRIPVAAAYLDAVKTGRSSLSVSVRALYDPEGAPITGTARPDPESVHVN